MSLDELRRQIDEIDAELVRLLVERGRVAQRVGELKADADAPVYAPNREAELLQRLLDQNLAPLAPEDVEAVFREIISACRGLQRLPRVAYLGPEHTFTHLAARKRFGHRAQFQPRQSIDDIFDSVQREQTDFGVVPIQNSTEGVVGQTLDCLLETPLQICAEEYVQIHHYLAANCAMDDIRRVMSHPQVLAQCRIWLREHLPGVEQVAMSSSAAAARAVADAPATAAICTRPAAEAVGLDILAEQIEDMPDNYTRFFVIGDIEVGPTGRDKTSVVFSTPHRAGALHRALGAFADHDINLTLIQSRPARARLWEYVFFVDFECHRDDPGPRQALDELRGWCPLVKVLGSYPAEPA